jgi:REP element-mobilizing transposase RayT
MSRPLRLEFPGSFWHITQRGNEQRNIFADDEDRTLMLQLLEKAVKRFDWILTSYTWMTNHYHFSVELTREKSLSRGMHWFDGQYAQAFNRRHKRKGHLYQGRFDSRLVQQETYFLNVLRYVVLNPVRANMVAEPDGYRWTSYPATVGAAPAPPWLAVDRVLAGFARDPALARSEYRRFVHSAIGDPHRLWDDVVGQIYLGSEEWVARMQEKVAAEERSVEHPKRQILPLRPDIGRVLATIAVVLGTTAEAIRCGRGGTARMLAAWLGYYEGALNLRTIAAALQLKSSSAASKLISLCEKALDSDRALQESSAQCIAKLRTLPYTR